MRLAVSSIGAVQSMSRKGNCWDNAVAESFFKTIKEECINRHEFKILTRLVVLSLITLKAGITPTDYIQHSKALLFVRLMMLK